MPGRRLQEFFLHPGFLSLIIWSILILFIPQVFDKYRIIHIEDEYIPGKTTYFFNDLDYDGNSEKISFDLNDIAQTKIIVSKNNKILDEYDLKYQSRGAIKFFADDFNHDGHKECYVFTMNQDSIFLNIFEPLRQRKIILSNRFIDFRRIAQNSADVPQIVPVGMIKGKDKNFSDLFFYITTGFSRQPRNVYRYLINKDSLIKSPQSGAIITDCLVDDINNDLLPEIMMDLSAAGNLEESFPFSDKYTWLMMLDGNLNFQFPPVRFTKNPSTLQVLPLYLKNKPGLIVFNNYFGSDNIKSNLYLFDPEGRKLLEKPVNDFENLVAQILPNGDTNKQTFYFLKNRKCDIVELDSAFQIKNSISIPGIYDGRPLAQLDIDLDGNNELIFKGIDIRSLVFVQNNFKWPLIWEYPVESGEPTAVMQVLKKGEKPLIYIQFRDLGAYIRYEKNPFYKFKYPFYGVLYLTVLLFIGLIARMQRYRLDLKLQTERQIASLQLKAIKNQVDPHFTLNILNAIGSLYATERDRDKADYIFAKYAKLIRQTVVSSDQIIITLDEEMEFVKNYIDLERFRCDNSFDYAINIDTDVDMQTIIPRMLIYTFVENAIKYGIRDKSEGALIKISIMAKDHFYQIYIEDNGPGLEPSGASGKSTGKGLLILNELIELYYKLQKVKITYTLQNITVQDRIITGTRAIIEVPRRILKS